MEPIIPHVKQILRQGHLREGTKFLVKPAFSRNWKDGSPLEVTAIASSCVDSFSSSNAIGRAIGIILYVNYVAYVKFS